MRRLRGQPSADGNNHLRVRAANEESELALLAQFIRHGSVASLANEIAERTGVRSGDLIAAAGLDLRRADR
jgi:hypothetical protein